MKNNRLSRGDERRLLSRLRRERRKGELSRGTIRVFRKFVYRFYGEHGRSLPWRDTRDPYRILVSEIMLQQTPVERVLGKYGEFISAFPDFASLGRASLRDIMAVWKGLGYNRRAVALKAIAETVVGEYGGRLPREPERLERLPGIGRATARSIAAFAFNEPVVFIETNIRSMFIHFFFPGEDAVADADIMPLVEAALDAENPRKWYSALMDFGTALKAERGNAARRSARYRRQAPFEGSRRQTRGRILEALIGSPRLTAGEIARRVKVDAKKARGILAEMQREGLIAEREKKYIIP